MTDLNQELLDKIIAHPDFQLLQRIKMSLPAFETGNRTFNATIIDLETMGTDAKAHEIIEMGLLSFNFSNEDGILSIEQEYNELNDPGKPIPEEISKITGITNDDVKGKKIDWDLVAKVLQKTHLIICHNSAFDRNFLEIQTPETVSTAAKRSPFACTVKDIDWSSRGYESKKLDYLNWKLGYFYDGHRALNDCWATLNLLLNEPGAFDELKVNVKRKQTLLCAVNAPFDKKELLKARQYRWSDGAGSLPKCWWICIDNDLLIDEKTWLDNDVYERENASSNLPIKEINARIRYSFRAESFNE
ncbi:DNA polymerase III subunit epsilon (plasmid) [Legionella israelensis]|uniref:3'-5' exonuclease n=1 Tax=Legionella israelensis TaxID=454 RepID=UPI00117ECA18|nr:3'-5' exonuclease [Legionella israelensis]QDP72192.1 DNA polymerase III subunit epsilon [Legionella israelensis]QDP73698.1 DNA polymerase III subunit epsilon [Legionella israelensis]